MKIRELRIKSYGKLKDRTILFQDGLNIVYGVNESGKSTIQSFIKAMLYGLGTNRKKDIRSNDRTRFLSLIDGKGSGELVFEYEGREYIVSRTFGSTKKEDKVEVFDKITGENIKEFSVEELGRQLLNLNYASFENTLFVKQLGGGITGSKEDEVMHKITNTFQSGEADISYQKAQQTMENMKKQLTTSRKNGELDVLKVRLQSLYEERVKAVKLSEDNIEDEGKLIELKDKRAEVESEIKKLELYKKHIRQLKLRAEYNEITSYVKKSYELKKKKDEYDTSLSSEDGIIRNEFVDELQDDATILFSLLDNYEEKVREKSEIENNMMMLKEEMSQYGTFEEIDEVMEEGVIKLSVEQQAIEEKISYCERINEELKHLEETFMVKRQQLGVIGRVEEYKDKLSTLLSNYEDKLKELSIRLKTGVTADNFKKQLTDSENKLKQNTMLLFITSILSIVALVGGLWFTTVRIVFIGIGIVLLVISGGLLKNRYRSVYEIKSLKEKKSYYEELEILKNEIERIEQELYYYCDKLDCKGYEQLIAIMKRYDIEKSEIDLLKVKIHEKKQLLDSYRFSELQEKNLQNRRVIDGLLNKTNSKDFEDFKSKLSIYKKLSAKMTEINVQWKSIQKNVEYLQKDVDSKKENLYNRLKSIKLAHIPIEDIPEELNKIKIKLKQREEIMSSLKASEEAYKALTKDKDMAQIENEIKKFIDSNINYSYKNEEDIEKALSKCRQEHIDYEKSIIDLQNSIDNKFLGKRRLYVIEEDIINVKKDIEEKEKLLKSIEVCNAVMGEAFKEVQKSFGPVLNKKVGKVFSRLTNEKYSEVMVTESYGIRVNEKDKFNNIDVEYLSNGTWDQAYLALRLALIDLLFGHREVPIILDDAFVQYDDERMKAAIDELKKLSSHKQIILFTCQKREVEYMNENVIMI